MGEAIRNRYDFVVLFDVENGNPNGDPDAGNMPRIDPETGYGLVTDVCLKRKIRNYVETLKEDTTGYKIYIKDNVPLNRSDLGAFQSLGIDEKEIKNLKKTDPMLDVKVRDFMCQNFYDIRTFGAVMTTSTGDHDYQSGNHDGGGCCQKRNGNGKKIYCSVWSVPGRGICVCKSGEKSDRFFGRGSGIALESNSEYV